MTPRAVQVWFQNRRQRQKPASREAAPEEGTRDELPTKRASPEAVVAAIAQQTAAHTAPPRRDPLAVERQAALAQAIAHAQAMQEKGLAQDRALGYTSLVNGLRADSPVEPPVDNGVPADAMRVAPLVLTVPPAPPMPTLPVLPVLPVPGKTGAAVAAGLVPPRLDPAQLLSLDAQSQQLELRAALLEAYAKLPVGQRYGMPGATPAMIGDLGRDNSMMCLGPNSLGVPTPLTSSVMAIGNSDEKP